MDIEMKYQLIKAIDMFDEEVPNAVTSPAVKHLLEINNNSIQLEKHRSEVFHYVAANLLYIMKRAQPDLELTFAFLYKRVSKSANYYWKKLRCLLGFVKGKINDKHIIGVT